MTHSFQINTNISSTLNNYYDNLVNNNRVLFALPVNICSVYSVSKASYKLNLAPMEGKSLPTTANRSSRRVQRILHPILHADQPLSHSDPRTYLQIKALPTVLAFKKRLGKVFKNNYIPSLTSKDAKLKS